MPTYKCLRKCVTNTPNVRVFHAGDYIDIADPALASRHFKPVRDTHESEEDFAVREEQFDRLEAEYQKKVAVSRANAEARKSGAFNEGAVAQTILTLRSEVDALRAQNATLSNEPEEEPEPKKEPEKQPTGGNKGGSKPK